MTNPNRKPSPPKAYAIELPANERGLAPDKVERFDKARAELLSPRLNLSEAQRDIRARTMADVEQAPRRLAGAAEIESGIAETVRMAEARGEEITTTKGGAKLIITNDGLWNLHERRKLTIEQYEEGCAYRKDRDARSADLGSQLNNEGSGSGHNHEHFVASRAERAFASAMVHVIENAVLMKCPANSLAMLRSVAGDGNSIAIWGKGRALDRNVADLAKALNTAAATRAWANKRKREQRAQRTA